LVPAVEAELTVVLVAVEVKFDLQLPTQSVESQLCELLLVSAVTVEFGEQPVAHRAAHLMELPRI
jgi:hypothetical protein